ncbi:hypothetical protein DVS77_29845 [Mycolicibacterium moriokaense]|nr:hypothetical protein DVS77_29845 [Mycolicibacterium moriokaense]
MTPTPPSAPPTSRGGRRPAVRRRRTDRHPRSARTTAGSPRGRRCPPSRARPLRSPSASPRPSPQQR